MTYSIVARSTDGETWGVAVASKFLAAGSAVPAAVAGVGAIATQADANVAYKGLGLALMDEGLTAQECLDALLEDDDKRDHRQLGIVDAAGNAVSYTGNQCYEWAGGVAEHNVAIQGNLLAGPEVVEAMKKSWDATADEPDLSRRLLQALQAGDRAGGDPRGKQSAALLVVREGAGYGGLDDIAADLRVDDHRDPVTELERLLDLNDLYLTASTDEEKVPVDDALQAELDERARLLGYADFNAWVASENYEMRTSTTSDRQEWVDEKVLAIIRAESGPEA